MLIAEAARLAAIEVLSPTATNAAGEGFPTIARGNVFDSRAAALADLNDRLAYTPTLALYTASARAITRADAAAEDDRDCETILEAVAELSVAAKDTDGEFADAMAGSDPEARLVLAGLCGQVEFALMRSEAGYLFRRLILGVRRVEYEPFALPHLGLRWQRTTMRFVLGLPDDRHDIEAGGLPEPMRSFAAALPEASYAKAKLTELAGYFAGEQRDPLHLITIAPPGGTPIASADLEG